MPTKDAPRLMWVADLRRGGLGQPINCIIVSGLWITLDTRWECGIMNAGIDFSRKKYRLR